MLYFAVYSLLPILSIVSSPVPVLDTDDESLFDVEIPAEELSALESDKDAAPSPTDWCFEFEEIHFQITGLRADLNNRISDAEIYMQSLALVSSFLNSNIYPKLGRRPMNMTELRQLSRNTPLAVSDHMFIQDTVNIVEDRIAKPLQTVNGTIYARMHPIFPRMVEMGESVSLEIHHVKLAHLAVRIQDLVNANNDHIVYDRSEISSIIYRVINNREAIRNCLTTRAINSIAARDYMSENLKRLEASHSQVVMVRSTIEQILSGYSRAGLSETIRSEIASIRTDCFEALMGLIKGRSTLGPKSFDTIIGNIRTKRNLHNNTTGGIYFVCLQAADNLKNASETRINANKPRMEKAIAMSEQWAAESQYLIEILDTY